MRIDFRQGIITYPTSGGSQSFLVKSGDFVSLRAGNGRVDAAVAHGTSDYLITESTNIDNAWGPIPSSTNCWLYWDIHPRTGGRTFGFTTVAPIYNVHAPVGVPDQHWFDLTTNTMKVYRSGGYFEVIRVFAARVNNSSFFPLSGDFPLRPFAGTQVNNHTNSVAVGRILFDDNSRPLRRDNGRFFTTEDSLFVDGSPVNPVRLEATIVTGEALEMLAKYQVVKFSQFGKLNAATYDDIQTTVIAMLMEDLAWEEVGNVCVQGKITNPNWNWQTVGAPLWITTGGVLTETDPHVLNAFVYPTGKPPVARVLTPNTIFFDQGLGGKGDKGDPGVYGTGVGGTTGEPATTSTQGVVRMSLPPVSPSDPIAVGNNDPRLSGRVLVTGDTMTGPLILNANPVAALGAATKQYVDTTTVGIAGDTMTGPLILNANPVAALGAATKQYVDNRAIPYDLTLACSDSSTALVVTTAAAFAVAPRAFTTATFRANLITASSVGAVVCSVLIDGTVVTTITIPATQLTTTNTLTISVAANSTIRVNIDGVGTGAAGLVVTIVGSV